MKEYKMKKDSDIKDYTFGQYLREIRKTKNISIRQLAKKVNKTPTYISDIENSNNYPPDKELLESIITALGIDEDKVKSMIYDLAAKERKDVPADVKEYIINNSDLLQFIRKTKDKQVSWSRVTQII